MIPFLDLKGLNAQYRAELIEACLFHELKGEANANN
jgi:hypothetical protein